MRETIVKESRKLNLQEKQSVSEFQKDSDTGAMDTSKGRSAGQA